jgi:hypothetical protein
MPFFDEMQNLVEPPKRPHTEVRTGLISHGRRGVARTARPDEELRGVGKLRVVEACELKDAEELPGVLERNKAVLLD